MDDLKQLCQRYIWYILVMWDLDNFDYTGNMRRAELHEEIALILGCSEVPGGYLKWALSNLEASAGLPEELPEREKWEGISKKCAATLAGNLRRIYQSVED